MKIHSRKGIIGLTVTSLFLWFVLAAASQAAASPLQCEPAATGLISWWQAEDDVTDASGNNNGTLANGAAFVAGLNGQAFSLDGVDDYVSIPNSTDFQFSQDFTFHFWVNFDTIRSTSMGQGGNIFLSHDDGSGTTQKWWFAYGGGALNFHVNGIGSYFLVQAPWSPQTGRWYHLAVRKSFETYTIFVDGQAVGSQDGLSFMPSPSAPLLIGQGEGLAYIDGLIDEVAIHNMPLSDQEITDIYNGCAPTPNTLTVTKTGSGSGTVTSTPTGIDCGIDCTEAYYDNTIVTLNASPDGDSAFVGWSGDPDCLDGQITLTADITCTSTFMPDTFPASSLRLWYAGDGVMDRDASENVQVWGDLSGNGLNVDQVTTAKQPLWVDGAVNGLPALRFDGDDDYLQTLNTIDLLTGNGQISVFVVAKPGVTQKTYADIFDYNHESFVNYVLQQNGSSTNLFDFAGNYGDNRQQLDSANYQIFTGTHQNGGAASTWINGGNRKTGATGTVTINEPNWFTVGNKSLEGYPRHFNGDIAEIILYNTVLSDTDRYSIEAYLADKYNINIEANLAVTITDTPDPVNVGGELVYTVTVINNGPADATSVMLTDALPTAVSNQQYSMDGGITWFEWTGSLNLGTIFNGGSLQLHLQGNITTVSSPTFSNMATVVSDRFDPDTADNTATSTTILTSRVLMINVNGTYNADGNSIYQTLLTAGADATYLNLVANGQAAALVAANSYDQIWVFDLSSGTDNYPTDWQAIAEWFNLDQSRAIICDSRMISSYWSGRWTGEGQKLTENYFYNMLANGGGLLLGTDHDAYHQGINSINDGIGLQLFSGNFTLDYIPIDTGNPLMNNPNIMGDDTGIPGTLFDNSSPGQTPYGLQPNGRILYTLAWHSGNPDTPGISSTIQGEVGFRVEINSPDPGSQFLSGHDIVFTTTTTNGDQPYAFTWSSDIDGALGIGDSLTVNSLTPGTHRIRVLAEDVTGRDDDDFIEVTVVPGKSLAVIKEGAGGGTVTSDQPGIDCGNDCSQNYFDGTGLTLTATPETGSIFAGWSGDCSGFGHISVTMDTDKTCTATFWPQEITINNDTTIDADNLSYEEADLTVGDGINPVTLTITGSHFLSGLTVLNNAVITHSQTNAGQVNSIALTVNGNMDIQAGAAINLNGRGFLGAQRAGLDQRGYTSGNSITGGSTAAIGGSHGGEGGIGSGGTIGVTYDDLINPAEPGSGGGCGYTQGLGGNGGGLLRLVVTGTLTNNGAISADGTPGTNRGGGGAGGTVWIESAVMDGSGSITASGGIGGNDSTNPTGGGGGGRIAIHYSTDNFSGPVSAFGGRGTNGGDHGGAGTIIERHRDSQSHGNLTIDNNMQSSESGTRLPDTAVTVDNVTIRNRGMLTHIPTTSAASYGLDLSVSGDLTLEADGLLAANGRGYLGAQRAGLDQRGFTSGNTIVGGSNAAVGGSHGGEGGLGSGGIIGTTYGNMLSPTEAGAGGGCGYTQGLGGNGGGLVKITVGGILTNNGTISTNGNDGITNGGGGAGGTIIIEAANVSGSGAIAANGGNGGNGGGNTGGGGGGRIVIGYDSESFRNSGTTTAYGGGGGFNGQNGGGGTIIWRHTSQTYGDLVVDNGMQTTDSGTIITDGPLTLDNILIRNRGMVTHERTTSSTTHSLDLQVNGDLTLEADGLLTSSGRGYLGGQRASTDQKGYTIGNITVGGSTAGNGGSHGGEGAPGSSGTIAATYGSILSPGEAGGGAGCGYAQGLGGNGGGVLRVTVSGTLSNDGIISANGGDGITNGGGGAGGSIVIEAGTVNGSGIIAANGGNGGAGSADTGGGGGGRIVIGYDSESFRNSGTTTAYGGGGGLNGQNGGGGTVIWRHASQTYGDLVVDNNMQVTDSGTIVPDGPLSLDNVLIRNKGLLTHARTDSSVVHSMNLQINGDLTLEADGILAAEGRGYLGGQRASTDQKGYTSGNTTVGGSTAGNGGSHAGPGGGIGNGTVADTYDTATIPVEPGGGGGCGYAQGMGGNGGGLLHVSVGGNVINDGLISVRGGDGVSNGGGGGGGSLYLSLNALSGSGSISAAGGDGGDAGAPTGGGGGGRLVFNLNTYNFLGTLSTTGGIGKNGGSKGTTGSIGLDTCIADSANLVSWWPAESTVEDAVGSSNGSLINGATFTNGTVGQAFSFDGVDDYVTIPDPTLQVNGELTLMAWVYLTGEPVWDGIITKSLWQSGYHDTAFSLKFTATGRQLDFWYSGSGDETENHHLVSNTALELNQWYHVAVTFVPATSIRIYINGSLDREETSGVLEAIYNNSTQPLRLGIDFHPDAVTESAFQGSIDEAAFFRRALGDGEIAAIHAAGSGGFCALPKYALNVGTAGSGLGWIDSEEDNTLIDCGLDCWEMYDSGREIILTAIPAEGTVFNGWTGDCSGGESQVTVSMDGDRTCTALFTADADFDGVEDRLDAFPNDPAYSLDADGDGMADEWENLHFNNNLNTADGSTDTDRDTIPDLDEFINGFDPTLSFWVDGLVAHYPFSGDSKDTSSYANDLTVNDATLTSDRFNNAGNAYFFDGNDYLQAAVTEGMPQGAAARTVSAWINRQSGVDEQGIIVYGTPATGQMNGLIVSGNNPDSLYFYGHFTDTSTAHDLALGVWTHVAMTYDGSTVKLYLDGALAKSASLALNTVMDANGLTVGLRPPGTYWNGAIDEVRVYNRALSALEIAAMHDEPQHFTLTVSTSGNGTVTSSESGIPLIDCGSDCDERYYDREEVLLTATPAADSIFSGWSGNCTGNGQASVVMDDNKSCIANFVEQADVTVAMTDSPDPVNAGQELTYTITVVNIGPGNADNIIVEDSLPSIVMNQRYSLDNGITWNNWDGSVNIGSLTPAANRELLLKGIVTITALEATANTATVTADTFDPAAGNNSATTETTVTNEPVLVNLNLWTEMDYDGSGSGSWVVSGDGLSVNQTVNTANPTFFVSDFELVDSRFEGNFRVNTTSDDDYIGFAFGITEFSATTGHYLVTWKQTAQSSGSLLGEEGIKLLRIWGLPTGGEIWDGETSTHVTKLASYLGSVAGWGDNHDYSFQLSYQPDTGDMRIVVRDGVSGSLLWDSGVVNDPDPIGSGRVGFFNYSQQSVNYSGFSQAALQPPVAVAGGPYTFDAATSTINLDATSSYDPDGQAGFADIISLQWDLGNDGIGDDEGRTNSIESIAFSAALAKGLAINNTVPVGLTVIDSDNFEGTASTMITYGSTAPTALAGGPYGPVYPGQSLTLSGLADDEDLALAVGETLTVEWDGTAAVQSSDIGNGFGHGASIEVSYDTLLASVLEHGDTIYLNVRDAAGKVGSDGATVSLAYPDLKVTNLTWEPPAPQHGQMVTLIATVENNSDANCPWNFSVGFQADSTAIGSTTVTGGLAAGATIQVSHNWTAGAGDHLLSAIADIAGLITESDETNNSHSAAIPDIPYILTVATTGSGSGRATSTPTGIDCGTDCQELFPATTVVTLTAVSDAGSKFDSWSGDCSGLATDNAVTMDRNRSCIATFKTPPVLNSFAPQSGSTAGDTTVTLRGFDFGNTQGSGTVTFDGVPAAINSWTDTVIVCETPPHDSGSVGLTVTTNRGQMAVATLAYSYIIPPAVSSASPDSGYIRGGSTVTITGTAFGSLRGSGQVFFNNTAAFSYNSWSDTEIVCQAPPHAEGSVAITVRAANGLSGNLNGAFTYVIPPPAISSIVPATGSTAGGAVVTISGLEFGSNRGNGFVSFGTLPAAAYLSWTDTQIVCVAPVQNAATVEVTVTTDIGLSSVLANAFTYEVNDLPHVQSIIDQVIDEDTGTDPISVTVSDTETPAGELRLTGTSSDNSLVDPQNIVFSGSGESRTMTITPTRHRYGETVITVSVHDAFESSSTSFTLTVQPVPTANFSAAAQTVFEDAGEVTATVLLDHGSDRAITLPYTVGGSASGGGVDHDLTDGVVTFPPGQTVSTVVFNVVSDDVVDSGETIVLAIGAPINAKTGATSVQTITVKDTGFTIVASAGSGGTISPAGSVTVEKGTNQSFRLTPYNGYHIDDIKVDTISQTIGATYTFTAVNDNHAIEVSFTNDQPTISSIGDQQINEDSGLGPLSLTINDAETTPAQLTVTGHSSNSGLVPANRIVFGGSEANRTVTVTPLPDQNGTATITLTVRDVGAIASTSFILTVNPQNDQPQVRTNRIMNIQQGGTGIITPQHLWLLDPDGDPINCTLTATPGHGILRLSNIPLTVNGTFNQSDISNGNLAYEHNGLSTIADSFSFTISDGQGGDLPATVFSISVNEANAAPVAAGTTLITPEDTAIDAATFTATDADNDGLIFRITTMPSKGRVTITDPVAGTYNYMPNLNENGLDTFSFRAIDSRGKDSNPATVSVIITPVNDPPTTAGLNLTTSMNTGLAVRLTAADADNDQLTYTISEPPQHGILSGQAPELLYSPATGWSGTEIFSYTAGDLNSVSTPSLVTITVTGEANQPPVAEGFTLTVDEDMEVSDVLRASDANNDILTFSIVSQGNRGSAQIINPATGAFTYTPAANVYGEDFFSFKASDASEDSNTTIVRVTIRPLNDPPVISGTPASTANPKVAYSFTPVAVDADGDQLYFTIDNKPPWAQFNPANGRLYGTPIEVGNHPAIVISVNDSLGSAVLAPFDIIVLGESPSTTATPAGGTFSLPQEVTLTCFAPPGSGCDIQYSLDPAASPENFTAYTGPVLIGQNATLRFYSKNVSGAAESVQTHHYTFDGSPPRVTITSPLDDVRIDTFELVAGTAADQGGILTKVELQITDGALYLAEQIIDGNRRKIFSPDPAWVVAELDAASGTWSYDANGINWPAATYTVTARATDAAGNQASRAVIFSYTIEGSQAYTQLSIEPANRAILENARLDITGQLDRLPATAMSLAGRDILLTINPPEGDPIVLDTQTVDSQGHYRFTDIDAFGQNGRFDLRVDFTGTELLAGSSAHSSVMVGAAAGYAVIVQGRISSGEGLDSHNLTANRIYNQLLERGFLDENIQYFNYNTGQPGVDQLPDKTAVETAITEWPQPLMNAVPAPFYVILVDHGNVDTFYLNGDNETIIPSELDNWLTTLESGLNDSGSQQQRVVIVGACYSGSFIPEVSATGRIVVSSAAANEESFKGPRELEWNGQVWQDIRVGEFFLEELFKDLGQGKSLARSFEAATAQTEIFTRTAGNDNRDNHYFDDAIQHPLLDDNGDGFGSNILGDGTDGPLAAELYLGTPTTLSGDQLPVASAFIALTPTRYLGPWDLTTEFWATSHDDNRVASTWIEVRPPSKNLQASGGTNQLVNSLSREMMTLENGKWRTSFDQFTESGKYEIYYFMRDVDDRLSPMARSILYRNRLGNNPPLPFQLLTPAIDHTTVQKTVTVFDWQDAVDPEGDPVRYNLVIARDSLFRNQVYRQEEIPSSSTFVDSSAGLADLTRYYWKVEAVDSYGGLTSSSQSGSFRTDNGTGIPGVVYGVIYDSDNFTRLPGSLVSTGATTMISETDGSFVLATQPGAVTLTSELGGFDTASVAGLMVTSGQATARRIGMTANGLVALGNSYTIEEDSQLADSLAGEAGGNSTAVYSLVGQPSKGTVELGDTVTGSFIYTPDGNKFGSDTFTFKLVTDNSESNPATISITITPVNDRPLLDIAGGFNFSNIIENDVSNQGSTVTALVGNAISDPDPTALEGLAIVEAENQNGSWQYQLSEGENWTDLGTVSNTGATLLKAAPGVRLRFVPQHGFVGQAHIFFKAWDRSIHSHGDSGVDTTSPDDSSFSAAQGTAVVTVLALNQPPTAADAAFSLAEDTNFTGRLSGSDPEGSDLLFRLADPAPGKGRVWFTNSFTGDFVYVPSENENGLDSFRFIVNDGSKDSLVGQVNLTIEAVNDPPEAYSLNLVTPQNSTLPVRLAAKDHDHDPLSYIIVLEPQNGQLAGSGADRTYSPAAGWAGDDYFIYRVLDSHGLESVPATVNISVTPTPNRPPSATAAGFTTIEERPFTGRLNGTDPDGDPLTFTIAGGTSKGTVQITNANTGEFLYTPTPDASGADSFSFRASDRFGAVSDLAPVTITIAAVDDPPTITGTPSGIATPGVYYSFTPVAHDPDGDTLTFTINHQPVWATFNTGDGRLFGTPQPEDASTTNSIVIAVTDGTSTVTLPPFDLVTVSNTVEPVSIASPAGSIYQHGQKVRLSCYSAADSDCSVFYSFDATDNAADFTPYSAPLQIDTSATLHFFAVDSQNNTETVRSLTYSIDPLPPAVSIIEPEDGLALEQLFWITTRADDLETGVATVELQITDGIRYLDGQSFTATPVWLPAEQQNTGDWRCSLPNVAWSAGPYTLTVRATDRAGNQGSSSSMFLYASGDTEPAYTRMLMELSSQSILQHATVDISGKFSRLPETSMSLAGREIILTATGPSGEPAGRYTTETYDQFGHYRFTGIGGFEQHGPYSLEVSFAGTPMLAASSASKTVLVGSAAGYAVIVQGARMDEPDFASRSLSGNRIYTKLIERGFTPDNIYYFSHDQDQPGVDAAPDSKTDIATAIQTWAGEHLNNGPAPLFLVLLGDGNPGELRINGENETINPAELHGWISAMESGLNLAALIEPRIIMLGSNYGGSFLPDISSPGRVVVTSAAATEKSFKGPREPAGPRSGDVFLENLFKQLARGHSLKKAFRLASSQIRILTRRDGKQLGYRNRYFDNALQHPLLDDNGDGVGANRFSDGWGDGGRSETIYLGTGLTYATNSALNPAEFIEVTNTMHLGSRQDSAFLWGRANDDAEVAAAWVDIRHPDTVIAIDDAGQPEIATTRIDLEFDNDSRRWQTSCDDFVLGGRYEIFYFVLDRKTNDLAPMQRSLVYRSTDTNQPPDTFDLLSPSDNSTQETVLAFDWLDSTDPDGDELTYTLLISTDAGFSNIVLRREELTTSATSVDDLDGLADLTNFFWKVEAVDSFGAITASTQVWQFRTDNTNGTPGILEGILYSNLDFALLAGALITTESGDSAVTGPDGRFYLETDVGTVVITITAAGYDITLVDTITVSARETSSVTIGLTSELLPAGAEYNVVEDTVLNSTLTAVAPGTVTFLLDEEPAHGTVTIAETSGVFSYTPETDYNGDDLFTFQILSDGATSPSAAILLTVTPENDPPASVADTSQTNEETGISIAVLTNDRDVDSEIDVATVTIVTPPANGTATARADGLVDYLPVVNFSGSDNFAYTVADDQGAVSAPAMVTVAVTDINDPPTIAGSPSGAAIIGQQYSFTALTDDVEDGSDLTCAINHLPVWATFEGPSCTLSGTPAETDRHTMTENIVITVTDSGDATTALAAFDLAVLKLVPPGDLDDSGGVDITDAILGLQVLSGHATSLPVYSEADVNDDDQLGMDEVLFILQREAGLR